MNRYWSPFVNALKPYVPGEQPRHQRLVKLNTNENPFGPSPKVLEALHAAAGDSLRLYPDPESQALCEAIARYHKVDVAQVFVGNGSDEVLAHAFNALFRHGQPLLFPDITYSFYPVYCALYDIAWRALPLREDFTIAVDDYRQPNGGIVFPNPNAPTGCLLPLAAIEQLLRDNTGSVVLVDEAYVDFGGESAIALLDRYPNLLVVQTLSKSRSLAGLRVGFAIGHAGLIEALKRVKDSFNSYPLDRLAQTAAIAAFEDEAYFQQCRRQVIENRQQLVAGLQGHGFDVLPSAANFVLARHRQRDAAELLAQLRERGVIVRHFKQERICQHLRISVGTCEQQAALLEALAEILAGPR